MRHDQRWILQRWTGQTPLQRRLIAAYAVIGATITLATLAAEHWLRASTRSEVGERARLERSRLTTPDRRAPSMPATDDFVEGLPARLRIDPVVRNAAAFARSNEVTLSRMDVQTTERTDGHLQQALIHAELRGSYSNLKLWLREMLARYPELAVVTLDLQRPEDPSSGQLHATIRLRLHAQPIAHTVSTTELR